MSRAKRIVRGIEELVDEAGELLPRLGRSARREVKRTPALEKAPPLAAKAEKSLAVPKKKFAQPKAQTGSEGKTKDTAKKPVAQVMPPPRRIAEYQDPAATVTEDWQWSPLSQVYEGLGGMSEIPPHVIDFGRFMDEQAVRAGGQGLTPRDLIKAFTVTRASIQRQATDAENLRRAGLELPEDVTGKVRPEGAFGEWLGTPAGQAYLDAAQYGRVSENAIGDAVAQMRPFGKQNDLREALEWAAQNLPGQQSQVSDLVAAGREGMSTPADWRVFTKNVRGIGPSKSGFLASLLGRGDQPTLDARQIILNTGRPTKEASRYIARRGGMGGIEGVERLSARQAALDLALPEEMRPYYQHLAHHAIWDKAGDETTTHSDVVNAMKNYRRGGLAVKRKRKKK